MTVSLVVTAMHDHDGHTFGDLGVAHDVTRQKEAEDSRREAMDQATRANAAKSRLLANMSHEIRTPLNTVIGLSYLLGHTQLAPDESSMLDRISVASKSLLSVINDDLALRQLVRDVSDMMIVQAQVAPDPLHAGDCARRS